jgi:hypothetical protein
MTINKIIAPFIVLLYLSATIGLAYYNCNCEQTQRVVLLSEEHCNTCEHHHTTTIPNEDNCCKLPEQKNKEIDNNCCKIVYKSIQIDSENFMPTHNISPYVLFLTADFATLSPDIYANCDNNTIPFHNSPPAFANFKTPLIYSNCQLRL